MKKNDLPLVSIVTPVYNTEKYLAECIESVLQQTYSNWEYIILNNRSTDRSLEISESYACKDSRIRVITNEQHLKQMANCNRVFHYISGESKYCKVIHADDWLFPECLTKMVRVAETYPSIGIVGAYRLNERTVNLDVLPYPSTFIDGKIIAKHQLLGGKYIFGSPSSLLIRSDLIRKKEKFYDESTLHGDVLACFDILREADFGFVHQVLTFTRRHNESATSFIRKYETYNLRKFKSLVTYGKYFLSNKEYDKRLKSLSKSYYRFLARKLFERKEKEFWSFHKRELKKMGVQFSIFGFFLGILWEMLNIRDVLARVSNSFGIVNRVKKLDHNDVQFESKTFPTITQD